MDGDNLAPLKIPKVLSVFGYSDKLVLAVQDLLHPYYGGYQKSCMTLGTLYRGNYGTIVHLGYAGFLVTTVVWNLGSFKA